MLDGRLNLDRQVLQRSILVGHSRIFGTTVSPAPGHSSARSRMGVMCDPLSILHDISYVVCHMMPIHDDTTVPCTRVRGTRYKYVPTGSTW